MAHCPRCHRESLPQAKFCPLYREMDMRFWLTQAEAELGGARLMLGPRCRTDNREGRRLHAEASGREDPDLEERAPG